MRAAAASIAASRRSSSARRPLALGPPHRVQPLEGAGRGARRARRGPRSGHLGRPLDALERPGEAHEVRHRHAALEAVLALHVPQRAHERGRRAAARPPPPPPPASGKAGLDRDLHAPPGHGGRHALLDLGLERLQPARQVEASRRGSGG